VAAKKSPVSRVTVRVPATTSNLGPGYDVVGMALSMHCQVDLAIDRTRRGPAVVECEGEGSDSLPKGEKNLVVRSFREVLPKPRLPFALRFKIKNDIPLARGLGSSAAARLAGLLAGAAARDFKYTRPETALEHAVRLEGHPDNCVPAFFGGFRVSVAAESPMLHFPIRVPKTLGVVVCVPDFEVSTEKARKVMPAKVPVKTAVDASGRLALLLYALESGSFGLLKKAMRDSLHEPHRAKLVPGYEKVRAAAERHGAFGACLSGSGPTVLALTPKASRRQAMIGRAMVRAFRRSGSNARAIALDVDARGTKLSWGA
jgi:homoserine kinase